MSPSAPFIRFFFFHCVYLATFTSPSDDDFGWIHGDRHCCAISVSSPTKIAQIEVIDLKYKAMREI